MHANKMIHIYIPNTLFNDNLSKMSTVQFQYIYASHSATKIARIRLRFKRYKSSFKNIFEESIYENNIIISIFLWKFKDINLSMCIRLYTTFNCFKKKLLSVNMLYK